MRRATRGEIHANSQQEFLSTLSLRRATINVYHRIFGEGISIHALLAESDNLRVVDGSKSSIISIHALLAESDVTVLGIQHKVGISIHALLAESDHSAPVPRRPDANISIHALLAESDILKSMSVMVISISIHALLAESDKVVIPGPPIMIPISIHALLAESDWGPRWIKCHLPRFLSTLSLRRATTIFHLTVF